ncbi:terminase family protein [Streptomyces virginiae]|uniref:terminase large subunit domain-containing protein n=1 Tax=Streptomyces virginiae TaxID=1961 RepID=UPI00343A087B
MATPGGRLLITTPPQIGKSVTAATYGPAWYLLRNPTKRIIVATYADSLARRRGRDIRTVVAEHGRRWGVGIERGSASVVDWSTTAGGGIRSVGIGGGLTGFPADAVLVDDAVKDRVAAESPRAREAVWAWWSAVLRTRLAPGAPIVLIMTRWHPLDLAGQLLDADGRVESGGAWRVVHLPALADPVLTGGADPLGRAPGDPLSHPRIADGDRQALLAHWHAARKAVLPRDWASLYQGDPRPAEGALISSATIADRCLPATAELPGVVRAAVAIDPSGGGKDEAGIVGGVLGTDRRVYIVADWSGTMPSEEWARRACTMALEINADLFYVEANFGADMCGAMLRAAWQAMSREGRVPAGAHCPYVADVTARKGKFLRAEPAAQLLVEDRVRIVGKHPELINEWTSWRPGSGHSPGRLDASTYLILGLTPYTPPIATG